MSTVGLIIRYTKMNIYKANKILHWKNVVKSIVIRK